MPSLIKQNIFNIFIIIISFFLFICKNLNNVNSNNPKNINNTKSSQTITKAIKSISFNFTKQELAIFKDLKLLDKSNNVDYDLINKMYMNYSKFQKDISKIENIVNSRIIKVITWNVWFKPIGISQLNKNNRIKYILKKIGEYDADFVCLQEIDKPILEIIKKNIENKYYIIENRSLNNQYDYTTLILSKHKKIKSTLINFESSQGRNYLTSNFMILENNFNVKIGNFHLESLSVGYEKRIKQLKTIFSNAASNSYFILMGDTNFIHTEKEPDVPKFIADSFIEANQPKNDKWTYDGSINNNVSFENKEKNLRWPPARFDRVYFNKNKFKLKKFELIKSKYLHNNDFKYPSDHFGIYIELLII